MVQFSQLSICPTVCYLSTEDGGPKIWIRNEHVASAIVGYLTNTYGLHQKPKAIKPTKRVLMVKESSSDSMTDKINSFLKDGWELKGNPFMSHGYWCQLMEKTDA